MQWKIMLHNLEGPNAIIAKGSDTLQANVELPTLYAANAVANMQPKHAVSLILSVQHVKERTQPGTKDAHSEHKRRDASQIHVGAHHPIIPNAKNSN